MSRKRLIFVSVKSLLLTGGLGQVGYHLYQELKNTYDVTIFDNNSNPKVHPTPEMKFVNGFVENNDSYLNLGKIDIIVHCAAQISVNVSTDKPIFDATNNIIGTLNLLEYARKYDIERFVYLSSAATYGEPVFLPVTEEHPRNPLSPYGLSKLTGERYVKMYSELYGLDTITLIPFNIYSALQKEYDPYSGVIFKFLNCLKNGVNIKIEGDGLQTRDFVHVNDVVKAIKLALITPNIKGQEVNIGYGQAISIKHLAETLLQVTNSKLAIEYSAPRVGDIRDSYCSINKAKTVLGFVPDIDIKKGLELMCNDILQ